MRLSRIERSVLELSAISRGTRAAGHIVLLPFKPGRKIAFLKGIRKSVRGSHRDGIVFWVSSFALLNARMLKYGLVGCAGIMVNLGTMALFLTLGFGPGWMPSAIGTLISTCGNFILHNRWTFSDRQHQGLGLVRAFLCFAFVSTVGVSITTAFYIAFTRIVTHLAILTTHLGALGIPLTCQFGAVLMGACTSYLLNKEFTWPRAQSTGSSDIAQVQVQET